MLISHLKSVPRLIVFPLPLQVFLFTDFLVMLGLRCCTGFSLVASSGSYSLVVVRGLLGM